MDNQQTGQKIVDAPDEAPIRILIVDAAPVSNALLQQVLARDYLVLQAKNSQEALDILHAGNVNMVLSDIFMPEISGLELLKTIKADENLRSIPVMMITADGDVENEVEALRLGAVDIVRKPIIPQILLARVRNFLVLEKSFRAMEENLRNQQLLKEQAEALRTMEQDELTGVLNRQAFYRHVRDYLDRHPAQALEIIRFDLDNFSTINDLMGVKAGDRLLREIGQGILNHVDDTADILIVGRIEADHFVMLHDPVQRSAELLFNYAQSWLDDNEAEYRPNGRFGIYGITDPSMEPAVMCDRALLALRSTKGLFTQRTARYNDSMRQKLLEEQKLTEEMLPALESGQFEVYYQPQVNYSTNSMIGAEALVRWNHPEKGLLPPSVFLPLFERNGQITQLDNFVWESVCRQLADWRGRFGDSVPPISVNISRVDIYGKEFLPRLTELTDQYKIPRSLLQLEITESAYVEDARRLCRIVEELSAAGFIIEMDDFGSAYSSLNMLKDIPVDILKLDMVFLSDTKNSARGGNILSSVVRMARWLKLPVIAEGVETKQQADYLCSIGCLYTQGYYFSKPVPANSYEAYFQERMLGKTDKYRNTDISAAESFWDASTQTALIFNSYIGGSIILQRTGEKLEMLRANDEFFKVIHVSREEYLASMLNVWQRFLPEDQIRYCNMLDKASRSCAEASCDLRSLPLSSGRGDWTRNRAKLLAKNGESEIFFVSVENITAEKAAKEELAQQKDLLYTLYNGVPCGIVDYLVDAGNLPRMVNFNDMAWKLSGYEGRAEFEKAYGEDYGCAMVHPDDLAQVLEKVHTALSSGVHTSTECRIRRQDHSYFWAEIRVQSYSDGNAVMLQSVFIDIEDRREQETQKYGKILFSIFDEIFLWDYQEDACHTIKGIAPYAHVGNVHGKLREMMPTWIREHVIPEDQVGIRQFVQQSYLQKACAGKSIPYVDYRISLPNGTIVATRASAFAVDKNRFMVCCRDVTKEKQAAEQTKQIAALEATLSEQERYRIIVEQTGTTVIEWNHETGEFFHSKTYDKYEMSKLDPTNLFQNRGQGATVYKADMPVLHQFFADTKSGKPSAEAILRLRMTDGSFRWTCLRGDFLFDANGMPLRTIGTLTDIDNEMRAKETLQETNVKLKNIITNIPAGVGIFRIDLNNTAVPLYISDRTCKIFGYTREECDACIASGKPIRPLSDLNALLAKQIEPAKNGESVSIPRIRAKRKDGSEFWLRLTCSFVITSGKPTVCYATLLDISHLVEAEQAADSVRELYQLIIESTETITLDYSVPNDFLRLSYVGIENVRKEKQFSEYLTRLQNGQSNVAVVSRPALLHALESASSREMHGELDIQACGPDGIEHWYHIKFLSLSEDGTVYRVVGRADNFDGVVRFHEAKLEMAQIDRVTGLRSKDSARAAVEQKLLCRPQMQRDAILFLDIDNFKIVNDTEGHLTGDRILADVAKILRESFRAIDVIARFGGDEFLIYMIAPKSMQAVIEKAQWILKTVQTIKLDDSNMLGCSIGIVEVAEDIRDFDTVFRCVDRAMYLAKQGGKNRFAVCSCSNAESID